MSNKNIKIGLVGAGGNTKLRHIPGFQAIDGVEIVSVANRSRESSEKVAKEFNIPKTYDNWLDLVEADDTDAICIGTWPYLHCPVTLEALACDKHVLVEARMAMNSSEARLMLQESKQRPHLITQIVPAPHTLVVDQTIQELLADGYVGDILAVEMTGNQGTFADFESPLHWRQDFDLSGYNIMTLGIWYEALVRWVGPANRIMAITQTNVNKRKNSAGELVSTNIPDHVEIICNLEIGSTAHIRVSSVTGLAPSSEVYIFGTEGTLRVDMTSTELFAGKKGDEKLSKINIPDSKKGGWRVEEEFINAIRGEEEVTRTNFYDGVRYMDFTEAVTRSSQENQGINLPLDA